jgi:VWFA-related protein
MGVTSMRLAAMVLLVAAGLARGGDQPPQTLTFGATARTVRVPVSVLDKRGQPVLGLRGGDFRVTDDGRRQDITYFSGDRRPLRLALALDVSGSMEDKMDEVAAALRHFINLLEPADEILVMTFSSGVYVDQDFTSDRTVLERVFTRLQAAQGTALFDAAIAAINQVAPAAAEARAVVLVTDGKDTASRATFEELREVARRSEVPVFSLGIGNESGLKGWLRQLGGQGGGGGGPRRIPPHRPGRPDGPRGWPQVPGGPQGWPGRGPAFPAGSGSESDFDPRPLLDLAEDTGGRAEILKGLHDERGDGRLKAAVESIAVTLRHRYLVGYEPESGRRGWRSIRVEVDRASVRVQARKGYYTED